MTQPAAASSSNVVGQRSGAQSISALLGHSRYGPLAASTAYRKVLRQSVAAICVGNGFDSVEASVLELLTHIASAYMKEICEGARQATEVSGRTNTVQGDVWVSLINMGHDVSSLPDFLVQQHKRCVIINPPQGEKEAVPTTTPMKVGRQRLHHSFIHDHFPPFPDAHTYVRTDITLEPEQSYERAREQLAQRKRDAEDSLNDLLLRTHPSICLFSGIESRIREEAKTFISERREQTSQRREKRKDERRKGQEEATIELPDELMDDAPAHDEASSLKEDDDDDDNDDEYFDLEETEASILRKRIPAYCFVLDPTEENRPYLSALLGQEGVDDEDEGGAGSSGRGRGMEMERRREGHDHRGGENPFTRPPRVSTL